MPSKSGMSAARLKVIGLAAALVAVAIPLLVALPGQEPPAPPVSFPWWTLAIGFAITETFVIRFHVRRDTHTVSLSEIPFMIGLAMADPVALVAGRVVGAGLVLVVHRRQAIHKLAINSAIFLLDSATALLVYRSLLAGRSQVSAAGIGAGFTALVAALLVGIVVVGVAIRITQPGIEFRSVGKTLVAAFIIGIIASTLGVAGLVLAWQDPLLLVGVAVAAGGVYSALRLYGSLGKRFDDLEAIYEFTSEIDAATDTDGLADVTLNRLTEVFGTDFAEIVFSRGVGSIVMSLDAEGGRRRPAPPELIRDLAEAVPEGDRVASLLLEDAPRAVRDHYRARGASAGIVALMGGEEGTGTMLVVGDRSDGLPHGSDDLRLLSALARQARISFDRGRLVDRLRREVRLKEYQSVHDVLTGLPNRLHFTFLVEQAVRRAREADGTVAVLLADLDRFKEVNDTLGHQRGDVLLREMAIRLNDAVAGEEHVARLGGDEFAVLLQDIAGVNEATEWAAKISSVMNRPFVIEGIAIQVGGSIGIALAPDHGTDGTTLLRRADVAMYEAKSRGSSYEVYDQQNDRYSTRRLAMAAELRSAIETDEILLAYQPKADVATLEIVGVEALARWRHPRHGAVSPDEFVELAERTGLIESLTDHVLRTALRDAARLASNGLEVGIAVNIAASSLLDEGFPAQVQRVLDEFGVSPQALTLEVTESTMMSDSARSRLVVTALAEMGVVLAIDDYGTGYSSLTYLSNLPVQEVKIDRSFVTEMAVDERLAKIVSSTTALVHSLGKRVVAEGVENAATWSLLAEAGCDVAQGYYLARPMAFADLRRWLHAGGIPVGDSGPRMASAGGAD